MEWTTGMKVDMMFNKEQYEAIFQSYYDLLVWFHEGTKQAKIVPKICKKLLKSVQ